FADRSLFNPCYPKHYYSGRSRDLKGRAWPRRLVKQTRTRTARTQARDATCTPRYNARTKFREENVRSPETDNWQLVVAASWPACIGSARAACSTLARNDKIRLAILSETPAPAPTVARGSTMLPRDNKRALLLPTAALDDLGNDLLVRCASYLDADGLAQLGRTSARFGIHQAGQQRSLANEAARQRFRQSATDEERSRLPKYGDESDVGLLRALEQLRKPLCFDELVGNGFSPQEHPASVTHTGGGAGWSTAVSGHVMRGGRHFVEFAIKDDVQSSNIYLGVIRPISLTDGIDLEADWGGQVSPVHVSSRFKPALAEKLRSQRTAKWEESNVHCCTFNCVDGRCCWTDWDNERGSSNWQGQERLQVSSAIGLLLDLDEGTLSVFKDGRRLGVIKEGLSGEYWWFVAVGRPCTISISRGRAPN
ncbi:hypothetical protein THAOC_32486, partial [Thalassiosira oceanica]